MIILEINKIIKLRINENNENLKELENTLNAWNIAKYKYRRNENFDLPSTLKASMKLFDCFGVSHLTFCETGFSIDFENNEIKLTSLEKYKRITLKINEENMEYLKKEIENGAKPTMIMILPPNYKKGHHRRKEIVKNKHWKLHITLKKNIELLTKEEFRKFQKISIIGVDLNSKYGVAYSIWIWNTKENSIKPVKFGFVKPKIKSHQFQEIEKWKLQMNHGVSVKDNELYQRINKRIQRQNKDWIEKISKMLIDIALKSIKEYNCEIAIISFEKLKNYKSGNNNKRTNKKNAEWLKGKIIQRVYEKSLWNYLNKILTYLPTYSKNQRNLEQILIDADYTSIKCSRRGSKGIKRGKEFFCNKCRFTDNIHINASRNIAKRTIEYLSNTIALSETFLKRGRRKLARSELPIYRKPSILHMRLARWRSSLN